jgi:hypothetical protein
MGWAGRARRPYGRKHNDRHPEAIMPTLHIEHPITDFTTWKAAFDRIAPFRKKSGVLHHRVQRPVGEPNYVVIDLDFDTTFEAETFLNFLETEIWSTTENSPALVGTPQTKILESVEDN